MPDSHELLNELFNDLIHVKFNHEFKNYFFVQDIETTRMSYEECIMTDHIHNFILENFFPKLTTPKFMPLDYSNLDKHFSEFIEQKVNEFVTTNSDLFEAEAEIIIKNEINEAIKRMQAEPNLAEEKEESLYLEKFIRELESLKIVQSEPVGEEAKTQVMVPTSIAKETTSKIKPSILALNIGFVGEQESGITSLIESISSGTVKEIIRQRDHDVYIPPIPIADSMGITGNVRIYDTNSYSNVKDSSIHHSYEQDSELEEFIKFCRKQFDALVIVNGNTHWNTFDGSVANQFRKDGRILILVKNKIDFLDIITLGDPTIKILTSEEKDNEVQVRGTAKNFSLDTFIHRLQNLTERCFGKQQRFVSEYPQEQSHTTEYAHFFVTCCDPNQKIMLKGSNNKPLELVEDQESYLSEYLWEAPVRIKKYLQGIVNDKNLCCDLIAKKILHNVMEELGEIKGDTLYNCLIAFIEDQIIKKIDESFLIIQDLTTIESVSLEPIKEDVLKAIPEVLLKGFRSKYNYEYSQALYDVIYCNIGTIIRNKIIGLKNQYDISCSVGSPDISCLEISGLIMNCYHAIDTEDIYLSKANLDEKYKVLFIPTVLTFMKKVKINIDPDKLEVDLFENLKLRANPIGTTPLTIKSDKLISQLLLTIANIKYTLFNIFPYVPYEINPKHRTQEEKNWVKMSNKLAQFIINILPNIDKPLVDIREIISTLEKLQTKVSTLSDKLSSHKPCERKYDYNFKFIIDDDFLSDEECRIFLNRAYSAYRSSPFREESKKYSKFLENQKSHLLHILSNFKIDHERKFQHAIDRCRYLTNNVILPLQLKKSFTDNLRYIVDSNVKAYLEQLYIRGIDDSSNKELRPKFKEIIKTNLLYAVNQKFFNAIKQSIEMGSIEPIIILKNSSTPITFTPAQAQDSPLMSALSKIELKQETILKEIEARAEDIEKTNSSKGKEPDNLSITDLDPDTTEQFQVGFNIPVPSGSGNSSKNLISHNIKQIRAVGDILDSTNTDSVSRDAGSSADSSDSQSSIDSSECKFSKKSLWTMIPMCSGILMVGISLSRYIPSTVVAPLMLMGCITFVASAIMFVSLICILDVPYCFKSYDKTKKFRHSIQEYDIICRESPADPAIIPVQKQDIAKIVPPHGILPSNPTVEQPEAKQSSQAISRNEYTITF